MNITFNDLFIALLVICALIGCLIGVIAVLIRKDK